MKNIILEVTKYKELIEKQKSILEKHLSKAPEGNLKIDSRYNGVVFGIRTYNNHKEATEYIDKHDYKALSKYVNKRFAKDALNVIRQNLKACDRFLQAHSTIELEDVAAQYPEEFRKLNTLYKDKKTYMDEWRAAEFRSNQFKTEQLLCKASDGHMYRSKTEVMIAEILMKYDLPFRYECELLLGNTRHIIFPDFTILNPKDMKEWYFEHFGMMDNAEYASNAVRRITSYANAGYELGDRFIFTVECSAAPISMEYVERIIRHYFID